MTSLYPERLNDNIATINTISVPLSINDDIASGHTRIDNT